MKTIAYILIVVLSTVLAAPMEDWKSGHRPFYMLFGRRFQTTSTQAPVSREDDSKDVSPVVTATDQKPMDHDEMPNMPGMGSTTPAIDEDHGQMEITTEDNEQMQQDCCGEMGAHEKPHDHMNADGENKDMDEKDQQEEQTAESQDSYAKVYPETVKDDIPEETESETPDGPSRPEISRELKPPHEESSWGDIVPNVTNQENESKDLEKDLAIDDAFMTKTKPDADKKFTMREYSQEPFASK